MDNFIGKEKTLKSDMIYEGKILNLRVDTIELNNKMYVKREIVEHNNAVAIIALDKDLNMFFVRQYRKAVEEALLEIPAGIIENNEEPKEAAMRETMEEIGLKPLNLEFLFDRYSSPGFSNESINFFLATDFVEEKLESDEDEILAVEKYSIKEAVKMIERFEISDLKTIIGVYYAAMHFKVLK